MHTYDAIVKWKRQDQKFTDNRYSRGHEWSFDGGVTVPASSSPAVVPPPLSVKEAVDPEEALVAATSSCHMLWFLYFAARNGFTVDAYTDDAFGVIGKDANGRQAITRITLRPKIEFSGAKVPSADEVQSLHHSAHEECFIANSLKSEVVVEPAAG